MTQAPIRGYIRALDGLRGIAVLAVIIYHLAPFAEPTSAFGQAVFQTVRFGWTGVDLFFVLSGFLITGILYDQRHSPDLFKAFYFRRLIRIFPLYYLVVAALTVAVFVVAREEFGAMLDALPWHAAYLTNIRIALLGDMQIAAPFYTGHFWSLAVEEQFYLVWPTLVILATRSARFGWDPRRTMMGVCLFLIATSVVLRTFVLDAYPQAVYVLLPTRMDALAIGAFTALWLRGPDGIGPALRWSGPVLGLSALGLALIIPASLAFEPELTRPQQTVGFTLWSLFFAAILVRVVAAPDGWGAKRLCWRPLVETGRISYGLYIYHVPVLYGLGRFGLDQIGFWPFGVVAVGTTFLIAFLSWRFFEAPILLLKKRFPYDSRTRTAPPLPVP